MTNTEAVRKLREIVDRYVESDRQSNLTRNSLHEDAREALRLTEDAVEETPEPLSFEPAWRSACARAEKLEAFKDYVHKRLDDMGIPVDPPSGHREAGCRIGGRLDVLRDRLAAPITPSTEAEKGDEVELRIMTSQHLATEPPKFVTHGPYKGRMIAGAFVADPGVMDAERERALAKAYELGRADPEKTAPKLNLWAAPGWDQVARDSAARYALSTKPCRYAEDRWVCGLPNGHESPHNIPEKGSLYRPTAPSTGAETAERTFTLAEIRRAHDEVGEFMKTKQGREEFAVEWPTLRAALEGSK